MMIGPKLQQPDFLSGIQFQNLDQHNNSYDKDFYEGFNENTIDNNIIQQQQQNQDNNNNNINVQPLLNAKEIVQEPPKPKTPQELKIEKYQKLADQALSECKKFQDVSLYQQCENKKGITGYKKESAEGIVDTMGIGTIKKSELKYVQWYFNNNDQVKVAKALSPMQVGSQVIEVLNDQMKLMFTESSPPMATNRYSKFLTYQVQEKDIHYFVAISCDFPNGDPKDLKKIIESKIIYNGFIISPIKDNEEDLQIQMVSSLEIGGSLPGFIVNKVKNNRGFEQIKLMKEFIAGKIKEENKKK